MGKIRNNIDATADSYPFVTGMGFRNRCHFVFDEFHTDNPSSLLHDGSVVFIKTDLVPIFFKNIMPNIHCDIKIVTHNSALGIDKKYENYLNNPRVVSWHAQNANFKHQKLHSIPLGLGNRRWLHGSIKKLNLVNEEDVSKEHLLYMNFDIRTNVSERTKVYDRFKDKDYVLKSDRTSFEQYLRDLKASKYCLSHPGAGIDCHRIWESLSVGTIPIVERCNNISFYEHMPILIIDNWNSVTEDYLNNNYQHILNKGKNSSCLFMDYWIEKIGLLNSPRRLPAGVIVPPGCSLSNED